MIDKKKMKLNPEKKERIHMQYERLEELWPGRVEIDEAIREENKLAFRVCFEGQVLEIEPDTADDTCEDEQEGNSEGEDPGVSSEYFAEYADWCDAKETEDQTILWVGFDDAYVECIPQMGTEKKNCAHDFQYKLNPEKAAQYEELMNRIGNVFAADESSVIGEYLKRKELVFVVNIRHFESLSHENGEYTESDLIEYLAAASDWHFPIETETGTQLLLGIREAYVYHSRCSAVSRTGLDQRGGFLQKAMQKSEAG